MGVKLKGKVLTWDNEFAQENSPFNPSLKNILEVLNRLYRAPLEPDNWTEFLKDMAELFESNGAHIGIMDLATGKILMDAVAGYDISPTDYEVYTGHVPNDPRVAQMLKQPFRPTHCREFMEDQDFRDTDVYLEVLSKVDIEYTLCVGLSSGQKYLSFFALMRGREAQPFNEAERSLLELLAPHIGNAIELDHALTESHDLQSSALGACDKTGVGWIALDERGFVLKHNEVAAEILPDIGVGKILRLQDVEGVPIMKIANTCLQSGDVKSSAFNCLAQDGQLVPTILVRLSEDVRLLSWVQPAGTQMNVLFAPRFSAQQMPKTDVVRAIFGLSIRQAELTMKLVSGHSLREAAQSMGVQESTARQYIKGAMARLGVKSQTQLVARVSKVVFFKL